MAAALLNRRAVTVLALMPAFLVHGSAIAADYFATLYAARITSANAWHDLITRPAQSEFVDTYVAVAALSRELNGDRGGALAWDLEGQVGYNFGDQSHWEFNVGAGPRWRSFPWNDAIATTAAFRIGLSMASERPELEVELEGSTERLLIYWVVELTVSPPGSAWAVSLRLHHRSPAFGLLAEAGGMNALGLGVRRAF
jgi:hypothetical protein